MKYLSFDLRALALMRIAIAIVIILDLFIRLSDLETFYADTGVAPLAMIFNHAWNPYFISLHAISGLWQVQFFLFLISFFCACMLLIGYRTQLFTILSWILLLSLHNRNTLILQGGDDLLRMVLFWGIFLPWGEKYACDTIQRKTTAIDQLHISVAAIAYILQICYLYTGSALLKGTEWNTDFTAVYYAFSLDQIAYPLANFLLQFPHLLKVLTMIAYYFELLVPVLFFIPIFHGFFRFIAVLLIIGFHTFNASALLIGLFPLIGITTSLGILPSFVMNWFDKVLYSFEQKIRIVFQIFITYVGKIVPWRDTYIFPSRYQYFTNGLLIFLLVFVSDWNLSNLSFVNTKMPDNLRFIGYLLRLDQSWGMFAPGVLKDDGWYILEGITTKKENIDLMHPNNGLTYQKPEHIVEMFKNDRWRKYSENLMLAEYDFMRGYYCNYRRRVWNESHPTQMIDTLRIIYMAEPTLPDYKKSIPVKNILWTCYN